MKKMRITKYIDDLHEFCLSSVFMYLFLNLYFINKVNKVFTLPV